MVEEKRVGREEFLFCRWKFCCVFFGEENLEIKYAIASHVIVLSGVFTCLKESERKQSCAKFEWREVC